MVLGVGVERFLAAWCSDFDLDFDLDVGRVLIFSLRDERERGDSKRCGENEDGAR